MYLGDNLLRDGITELVDAFREHEPDALILLTKVADPWHYGVAELDGDAVVRLVEKPEDPPSDLALVGVYMFTPAIFDAARAIEPSAARRARDHRRDPAPDRRRLEGREPPRRRLVEGHGPARRHARGQPAGARGPRAPDRRRARRREPGRGPGRDRGGRDARALARPRPGGHRRRSADRRLLRRALHLDRLRRRGRSAPRSSTRSCSPAPASRNLPARIEASLLGKNVKLARGEGMPKTLRMMVGDNSEITLP